jgi:hypothetical protein
MNPNPLTTELLAARLGIKPQSIRAALCRTGGYFGLRPSKAMNGRLLWPADAPEKLMAETSPEVQGGAK